MSMNTKYYLLVVRGMVELVDTSDLESDEKKSRRSSSLLASIRKVAEWSKAADCKSVTNSLVGSNPILPILKNNNIMLFSFNN